MAYRVWISFMFNSYSQFAVIYTSEAIYVIVIKICNQIINIKFVLVNKNV